MAKRKRESAEGEFYDPSERRQKLQRLRLEQKFEHGAIILHRALKLARQFERQKLGRRQKQAREKNEAAQITRLDGEVLALKVRNPFFAVSSRKFRMCNLLTAEFYRPSTYTKPLRSI